MGLNDESFKAFFKYRFMGFKKFILVGDLAYLTVRLGIFSFKNLKKALRYA